MHRVRAADDFTTIRQRMEELQRERAERHGGDAASASPPAANLPDAIAHVPPQIVKRYLAAARRSSFR